MGEIDLDVAQQRGARIAARAEIRDVRLLKSTVELHKVPDLAAGAQLTYTINPTISVNHGMGDFTSFVVIAKYVIEIVQPIYVDESADSEVEQSDRPIASIEFEHAALFDLAMREGDEPPKEDELESYAVATGQFAIYPYAREYIHNVTGRLSLPTLTIGVLHRAISRM